MTDQTPAPEPTTAADSGTTTVRELIEGYIDRASYASTMSERATLLAVAAGAGLALAIDIETAEVLEAETSHALDLPLHIVGTVDGDLR